MLDLYRRGLRTPTVAMGIDMKNDWIEDMFPGKV